MIGSVHDNNTHFLKSFDFFLCTAFAAGNNRSGVAHSFFLRGRAPGYKSYNLFTNGALNICRGLLLLLAPDFPNQNNGFCLIVLFEHRK